MVHLMLRCEHWTSIVYVNCGHLWAPSQDYSSVHQGLCYYPNSLVDIVSRAWSNEDLDNRRRQPQVYE
jgi:hypothetical protein